MIKSYSKQYFKRERAESKISPAEREISSGIIIYRRYNGEIQFLLLYYGRSQWTFPRGKIEKEERSFATALRETGEETGIGKNDIHFVDGFKTYENWTYIKNGKKIFKTVIFYLGETDKKNIKLEERSQGFGWFGYRDALKIFYGPKNNENRKVLIKASNFLNNREKNGKRNPVLLKKVSDNTNNE